MYKSRANAALEPDLFHLRDDRGPEVDVILDAGSDVTAVECKAGATVAPDFFAGLEALRTRVERELPHVSLACRLVYGGEQGQRRGSVRVVPWRDVADFSR
jgi:hypothetical protein